MPALNFQKRFAPLVESGEKRQTIRALRKNGRAPRAGDKLVLYTGMRTKNCRLLGKTVCDFTQDIHIKANGTVKIDGQALYQASVDELARDDGFDCSCAMLDWFEKTHGLPFRGHVIRWCPLGSNFEAKER